MEILRVNATKNVYIVTWKNGFFMYSENDVASQIDINYVD